MAAGTWLVYGPAKKRLVDADIDLSAHTFKCLLLGTGYSPSINADDDLSDISASEIADAGYARVTLGGITVNHSSGTVTFDCNDISFGTAVTLSAKRAAIYDDDHASDALLCVVDLNTAGTASVAASTNGTYQLTIDAAGVFTVT